jgi:hypothetical protein
MNNKITRATAKFFGALKNVCLVFFFLTGLRVDTCENTAELNSLIFSAVGILLMAIYCGGVKYFLLKDTIKE